MQQKITMLYVPVMRYEVATYTSKCSESGFDGDVFIMLQGKRGCSCQISLERRGKQLFFQPGQKNVFVVEVHSLWTNMEYMIS